MLEEKIKKIKKNALQKENPVLLNIPVKHS